MTSNDSIKNVETKTIENAQIDKIALDTLKVYNTLYITYFLLYC